MERALHNLFIEDEYAEKFLDVKSEHFTVIFGYIMVSWMEHMVIIIIISRVCFQISLYHNHASCTFLCDSWDTGFFVVMKTLTIG